MITREALLKELAGHGTTWSMGDDRLEMIKLALKGLAADGLVEALERVEKMHGHSSSCNFSEFVKGSSVCNCGTWQIKEVALAREALAEYKKATE